MERTPLNRSGLRRPLLAVAALGAITLMAGPASAARASTLDGRSYGSRVTAQTLAEGTTSTFLLPAGTTSMCLFVNVVRQVPGASLVHRHQAGMVYAIEGDVRLTVWADGLAPSAPGATSRTTDMLSGSGAFIPSHWWHDHANPAPVASHWAFLSEAPKSTCEAIRGHIPYVSPLLPVLPAGTYAERLLREEIEPGGSIEVHPTPAVQEIFVLAGSVSVRGDDGSTQDVVAGHGAFQAPGSAYHISAGDNGASLLGFEIIPAGSHGDAGSSAGPVVTH